MRLVSLCPSISETIISLGRADALVGVTRFCIHPAEVIAEVRKVGGTKDPHIDRIVALKPDLVFVNEEENRREDFDALKAAGIEVDVSMTRRVCEVPDQLRHVGARIAARESAELRAAELEAELQLLEAARSERTVPFSFAYLIWRGPWMAVGADTYVADLLSSAGGHNVLADQPQRYPEVSLDKLQALKPDVVFLPDEPFPFGPKHVPEVQAALPDAQIHLVSGDDCCWHGVRSLRGARLATVFAKTL